MNIPLLENKWARALFLFLALLGAWKFVVRKHYLGHYHVAEDSMYPAIPAGSRVFTRKHAYSNPDEIQRGDIVALEFTREGATYAFLSRVVGLPGDVLEINAERLAINGRRFALAKKHELPDFVIYEERMGREFVNQIAVAKSPTKETTFTRLTVPKDHFYVLGDNRLDAADSRTFGPVPFAEIAGKKW